MALQAKVGSFNTSTAAATNNVVVTGVGFQGKIAFFWWNGRVDTTDAAGRATHNRGFGVAISATDRRFMSSFSQDAQAAAVTNKTQGNAHCVGNTTSADAIDGLLDFVSWDVDGFTLVIDDAFSTDMRVHYLVLGGADLSNVVGGNFAKAASTTGNASVTGLAFQPDCVLLFSCNNNTINNTVGVDSGFYLGLALSSSNRAHIAGGSNDAAATMQTVSYSNDAEFMTTMVAGINNIDSHADFVSMNSDGFTINWSESNAQAVNFNYIAMKGCQFALGTALTQTDTSTPIEVATSFTPVAGVIFSHNKTEDALDALGNDDQTSIGAFTSTSERAAMAIADDDNVADSVVTTAVEHDEVYISINAATGAVQGLMDVQTIDSGGVDFIMDDADPAQAFFIYWLFGNAPTADIVLYRRIIEGDR